MKIGKTEIDLHSFFSKGVKTRHDDFMVALICGYQGTGKTYLACYYTLKIRGNRKIKTNIKSLSLHLNNCEYFEKIENIVADTEKNVIYIIDEISKKYTKDSKQDLSFLSWLQQSRKNSRYVFLITQSYLLVPNWLRELPQYIFTTHKVHFFPFFKTSFGVPVLDKESFEWTVDELGSIIYKRTKSICEIYDTYETIDSL